MTRTLSFHIAGQVPAEELTIAQAGHDGVDVRRYEAGDMVVGRRVHELTIALVALQDVDSDLLLTGGEDDLSVVA